jgi:phenylacetate-coenzyme A ligase PaaK-like adenylate-forming protein
MTVPAIFFLESVKPLSFVGSQALHFFEPMVNAFFQVRDYERFSLLMERRENLEVLLVKIEAKDEAARHDEKERRKRDRAERAAKKRGKEPS